MGGPDEVAELHRLSARALVALFGGTPGAEIRLAGGCALGLSGENVADLNMLVLGAPAAEAEVFLAEGMARAEARRLDLLTMMTPAVADGLAGPAERHGLVRAGEVPLMVLRGSAEVRLGRTCRIEEARDSAMARISGDLAAAAFDLPRDAVGRLVDSQVTATSAASIYVAFAGDEPMSSVTVTRTGDTAGIWTMATPPRHQGKGMGRALLTRVIERMRHEGVGRFFLFATAAGFPLYASLGFVTLAEDAAWVKGHSTQTHA